MTCMILFVLIFLYDEIKFKIKRSVIKMITRREERNTINNGIERLEGRRERDSPREVRKRKKKKGQVYRER